MSNPRSNLEVDEEEFARILRLVLGKARRYRLQRVEVSSRLVVSLTGEQLLRLRSEVEEAGFELVLNDQTSYAGWIARRATDGPTRFGSAPRGVRHEKTVDWAGGGGGEE